MKFFNALKFKGIIFVQSNILDGFEGPGKTAFLTVI